MPDIKNTFSKGITVLNVKTSNFFELNKIKTYISTLTKEIEDLNQEIGRMVYTKWSNGEDILTEDVVGKLQLIQEKLSIVARQEAEAENISATEKQILGEQDAKTADITSGSVLVCPECGQTYTIPSKFCRKCGTKMN